MSLLNCAECGREISSSARACPQCGAKRPRSKQWVWLTIGAVIFVFVIAALSGPRTYQEIADYEAGKCMRNSADGLWSPNLGVSLEMLCKTHGAKIAATEACKANAANCD